MYSLSLKNKKLFLNSDHSTYSSGDFLKLVNAFKETLSQYKRIALGLEDVYEFSAAFIAVGSLGKEMIVLPNHQEGTLSEYKTHYDVLISKAPKATSMGTEKLELNINSKITFFTSGSQGKSKTVSKTLELLVNECEALELQFGESIKDTVFLSTVGHQHIYGILFRVLWPLINDRTIASFNILYPETLDKMLTQSKEKFTLVSSPAFIKRLGANELSDTCGLSFVFSSGGKLEYPYFRKFYDLTKVAPTEVYGSTETGGVAFRTQVDANQYWQTLSGVEISSNSDGCLVVESRFILNGSFKTKDLVSILNDRSFKLLGRSDRILKIEEKRISLDEMERILISLENIIDIHCTVLNQGTREVIGCVIAESKKWRAEHTLVKVKEIKALLLRYFEPILIPKKFRFLDELPYNKQSKITAQTLAGLFND